LVLFSDAAYQIRRKELRKIFRPKVVPGNSDVHRTDGEWFFLPAFSYKKKRRGVKKPFADNFHLNIRKNKPLQNKTSKMFLF